MQAVGHMIKSHSKDMRLAYVSSERFTNEVINSLRYDRMTSFRDKYRSVDVLLIDDIEFIAGKERTQEEFFHTFNALYESQKQVVLSADCTPKEIPGLEERLRSRFAWGLTADLQPADLETKLAILAKKAESQSVPLPDNVALFITTRIKSSIRDLEGALIRLIAYSSLTGAEITLSMAQQVLKNRLQSKPLFELRAWADDMCPPRRALTRPSAFICVYCPNRALQFIPAPGRGLPAALFRRTEWRRSQRPPTVRRSWTPPRARIAPSAASPPGWSSA